ncbi:MAG: leucine-rich repeat protein, partial [Candidatus Planktophila sp.]
MNSRKRLISLLLLAFVLSGLSISQASAEPDTRCSGGGNYFVNQGVVFRPFPAPATKCAGDVVLDNSVTTIGASAFWGLTGIRSMSLPDSLTNIASNAFSGASSLVTISIPSSVTFIGTNVFSGTSSLTTFTVSSVNPSYSVLHGALFNKSQTILMAYPAANSQKSFTVPSTVTTIASSAFLGATSLTSITIPNSVTSIGESAFSGASSLASISFPASVTSIGANVLDGATSLAAITVDTANQNYVVSDGALLNKAKTLLYSFPIKSTQTSFTLPNTVKRIETATFRNARNLKTITLGSSLEFIGGNAFDGDSALTAITIPRSVTSIGSRAFYSTPALTSITVDANNLDYSSINGVLFDKGKESLIVYPAANAAKSFVIPSTVTEIAELALTGVKFLESISLEAGNTALLVSNGALYDNEQTKLLFYSRVNANSSFTVPSSVTEIATDAFLNTTKLIEINVEASSTSFISKAGVLFDIDGEILVAYPSGITSNTYTLPASVLSVSTNVFASSQFTTLVISDETDLSILADAGLSPSVRVITSTQLALEIKAATDKAAADKLIADKAAADKLIADAKTAADAK